MINIAILKGKGVSREAWKTAFTSTSPSKELEEFKKRSWDRVQAGIEDNLKSSQILYAIDCLWDTPLRQVSPTLLTGLMAKHRAGKGNPEDFLKVLNDFNLDEYLRDEVDPKTGEKTGKKILDVPAFFQVIIPIVRDYVVIRLAKITNDRQMNPFFKYEPIISTPELRAKCEILTQRVQMIATQYNYAAVRRAAVLKMLLYNVVLKFIEKEWDEERQLVISADGQEVERVVKEGLTYHLPHPSRTYFDRSQPVTSLLTDSGCKFAGYWRVKRYGDVAGEKFFFNKDKVLIGKNYQKLSPSFFSTIYPCQLSWPTLDTVAMKNDEESSLDWRYYSSNTYDQACVLVEHYEKIIPKDVGLGDYKYPVWGRFVFAGDGTVIWASPLPACPVIPYTEIYDTGRHTQASFALELAPFQDAASNQLTQAILSAKQNLTSAVWVDQNLITPEIRKALENPGESFYRSRKFIPVDIRKVTAQQLDLEKAVVPVSFPYINVQDCISLLNVLLNILERVSQVSAQEVGASATHEQTAEEQRQIAAGSSNRLALSSVSVDEATDAWKRQVYRYLMAYGDEDLFLQVPSLNPRTREAIEKMGFTVDEEVIDEVSGRKALAVRGKKSALQIETFAASRDGLDRTNTTAIAGAMSQIVMAIAGNQVMIEAIGPMQLVDLMNQVLSMMGLPRDFKLIPGTSQVEQQNQIKQFAEQLPQILQESQNQTMANIAEGIKPLVERLEQLSQAVQAAVQIGDANKQQIDALAETVENLSRAALPGVEDGQPDYQYQPTAGIPEENLTGMAVP